MHRFITKYSTLHVDNLVTCYNIVYIKEDVRYECCLPLHLFVFLSNIAFVEIMLPYLKTIRKLKSVTWSGPDVLGIWVIKSLHLAHLYEVLIGGILAEASYVEVGAAELFASGAGRGGRRGRRRRRRAQRGGARAAGRARVGRRGRRRVGGRGRRRHSATGSATTAHSRARVLEQHRNN